MHPPQRNYIFYAGQNPAIFHVYIGNESRALIGQLLFLGGRNDYQFVQIPNPLGTATPALAQLPVWTFHVSQRVAVQRILDIFFADPIVTPAAIAAPPPDLISAPEALPVSVMPEPTAPTIPPSEPQDEVGDEELAGIFVIAFIRSRPARDVPHVNGLAVVDAQVNPINGFEIVRNNLRITGQAAGQTNYHGELVVRARLAVTANPSWYRGYGKVFTVGEWESLRQVWHHI